VNELALFAGAGGGILGGHLLGWRTVCAVEWEPYPASVLCARQNDGFLPPFPIWDNVQTFDGKPWQGIVDVVSGGFPCQAYSTAAAGKNKADDLWPEMRRIVADVAPRYIFAENVSRIAIDQAANDCESMGYKTKAISISAKDLGADHIRERFWLFAYSDNNGKFSCEINAKTRWLQGMDNGIWKDYPESLRVVDGMACRMDRLKAIGNGQVPLVAATAWRLLNERLDGHKQRGMA
jgi:DNA (cytosine-5)-methyltransferase 1